MPFQGLPKSNAIQVALQIRQMRTAERQQKQKLEIERMRAQSDAQAAQVAEQRAAEKYRLERANSIFDLQQKLKESDQSLAPLLDAVNNEALPQSQRHAAAGEFDRSVQQNVANRVGLGQDPGSAGTAVGGQIAARNANVASERVAKISGKLIDEDFERRASDRSADIAVEKADRVILERNGRIRSLAKKRDKANDPETKAAISQDIASLVAARDAALTRGQPNALIERQEKYLVRAEKYDGTVGMINVLEGIAKRPELLGPGADLGQLVENVRGLGVDLSSVIQPSLQKAMSLESNSEKDKEFLQDVFIFGRDPETGVSIEESRLEEVRLKWTLLNALNKSGRVNKETINEIGDTIRFTGVGTSSAIAQDRIRASVNSLKRSLPEQQRSLARMRPEIEFGPDGTIVGEIPAARVGLTAPVNREGSLAPEPATPAQPQTPSGSSLDPIMGLQDGFTMKDLIEAARQSTGGK